MNAKKIEKWVLLEQSGELSPWRQKRLDACPQAQAIRDDLNALTRAVPSVAAEPSPWAATRIQARLQNEPRTLMSPARVWQPIVAVAACLTLTVTLFYGPKDSLEEVAMETVVASVQPSETDQTVAGVEEWDLQFEEDLAELEGLILDISDTSFELAGM